MAPEVTGKDVVVQDMQTYSFREGIRWMVSSPERHPQCWCGGSGWKLDLNKHKKSKFCFRDHKKKRAGMVSVHRGNSLSPTCEWLVSKLNVVTHVPNHSKNIVGNNNCHCCKKTDFSRC